MNDRQDAATNDRQDIAANDGAVTTQPDQRIPVQRGDVAPATPQAADARAQTGDVELLPENVLGDFRTRWDRVQVMFVDQPRDAVQQAQDLVDNVVDELTKSFAKQREDLTGTWTRGDDVSTEDLRLALQRYRSFFNRLLST